MAFTDALIADSDATVVLADRRHAPGLNAGFYEQASGPEICDYFQRALDHLLSSGQVTWRGSHEYVGTDGNGHRLWSRVTGQETVVRARKVVDATYLGTEVPAHHEPGFEVEP